MNEPIEATLRRLKAERDEADRRYNEALTEVDRAIPGRAPLDDPLLPCDEHQLGRLNEAWNTVPAPPAPSGALRQKLGAFVWGMVGPYLQRQLTFNSLLVDHLNRTVEAHKAAHRREVDRTAGLRAYTEAIGALHTRLMLYLQQVTAYVDTRDRDAAGGALVLNAALSGLAESEAKYRESFDAREYRYASRATALAAAHEELRAMVSVAQQAIAVLKRHVGQQAEGAGAQRTEGGGGQPTERAGGRQSEGAGQRNESAGQRSEGAGQGTESAGPRSEGAAQRRAGAAFAPSLDAYKYVGFENQFRGPESEIRERQQSYVPYFAGVTADVLDVGCGRGEFIALLHANGIPARGIDLNEEMAEVCRSRGLDVEQADAVGYLSAVADGTLGGIFAAQVVEHLEPSYLLRFLDLAFQKIRPGGRLVLETLNPACWTAFFESYIRDITHRWPLHPDTLKYLVTASGFSGVDVEFRSPIPPQDRLQPFVLPVGAPPALAELAETFNGNVERLNGRLFSYMDYAVVAQKHAAAP